MSELAMFLRDVALYAGIPLLVLLVIGLIARRIRWARNFDPSASLDFDEKRP